MPRHAVVIAGAGPTGLMLAGELALAGGDVAIVERRADQELAGARAGGLHSRTIEVLDQRGIADRFLSQGKVGQVGGDARPVLLDFGEPGRFDISPWADRVRRVDAKYLGAWELPVIGTVTAPAAVLIRPDGNVAWVGDGTDQGLAEALTTWFGQPH